MNLYNLANDTRRVLYILYLGMKILLHVASARASAYMNNIEKTVTLCVSYISRAQRA